MSGGATQPCLEPDEVLSYLEGRAGEAERRRIEVHTADCSICREMISALADTHSPEKGERRELLSPGSKVGRYVVLEVEAQGAMGVVYAAHDPELQRKVALKLLRSDRMNSRHRHEFEQRLRREAQSLAQLAHPNVVAAYDAGQVDHQIFVAMEYVEGETLGSWLRSNRDRSWREVLARFVAAGRGLEAAHRAGLVHRDFKPENVLIGRDGRVRVADFGLARANPTDVDPTEIDPNALTAEGTLLGTPAYMAPEQHRGEAADASSDQFSFCVALYYGLYTKLPFEGSSWRELADAAHRGEIPNAPAGSRVPRRIHLALLRGMSVEPKDRFESMGELLRELERDPSVARRQIALIGASLLIAAFGAVQYFTAAARLCRGAERKLEGVWDPHRKSATRRAILATGVPYAEAAFRQVEESFDAYAQSWIAMHGEACEATRVRGEQSDEILGLRMTCLDDRLRELRALGDRFLEADAGAVQHAFRAARELASLEGCADARALRSSMRPPSDPAKVHAVREQLAGAKSLKEIGRYAEGLERARAIAVEADAIGHRPLQAEAHHLLGMLAEETGDYETAEESLKRATWAAEAGRHDQLAAKSWTRLLRVLGHRRGRWSDARALEPRVTAALERMSGDLEIEAALAAELGIVEADAGRWAEAELALKKSLGLYEQRFGREDLRLVEPLRMLAWIAMQMREPAHALEQQARALAIQRRILSDDHPEVAATLESIAGAQYMSGEYAKAEAGYLEALRLRERAFGEKHASVANTLANLGLVYGWQGRDGEAVEVLERAVALDEALLGATHPTTLNHRESLALALQTTGRLKEALATIEKVLAARTELSQEEHPRTAEAFHTLALIEADLGRFEAALEAAEKSRAIFEKLGTPDDPALLRTIGNARLRLGRASEAIASLEEAQRLFSAADVDPGDLAWTDGLLARALIEAKRSPADRARGRTLLLSAHQRMKADDRMGAQLADLEAWMKEMLVR